VEGPLDVAVDEGGALVVEVGRPPAARAIPAISSMPMSSDSRAASSRNEPVPALQASFMA